MYVSHPNTSGGVIVPRPIRERHWPVHFQDEDGKTGCVAHPINYDELYNLKGRLLTLVDATFPDPEQRHAHKSLVWQTLRKWMDDIENGASRPQDEPGDQFASPR